MKKGTSFFRLYDIFQMLRRIRLLAKAVLRKVVLPRTEPQLEALVVSPGGVATTMVMEQLAKYCATNDPYDRDGLKHLPRPKKAMVRHGFPKVLFIAGDIDMIVESLERRGWLRIQAAKLACPSAVIMPAQLSKKAFAKCVNRQRRDWEAMAPQNIMFVEFRDIWERLPEIADHLGITASDFVATFPSQRPRHAKRLQ